MNRWAIAVLSVAFATGCGDSLTPLAPSPEETEETVGNLPDETISEGGITLSYYGQSTETGETPPTFTIKSDQLASQENDIYTFREAESIIYAPNGENLYIDAESVWLNYTDKRAIMEEGVTLRRGDMVFDLEELEWDNEERVAESDKPLTLTDGETRITADSMKYFPDEDRLTLGEAGGHVAGLGSPEL